MLSVVITAWNEEKNLPRVVKSVSGLADEVVVVDTQSTDRTSQVAKSLGCRVYHHKNLKIVEPVRNFSISKVKGDWILLLDADEEVSATLAAEIKRLISTNQADYVRLPRKNLIFGHWIKSTHWWPDYVYRLFKSGHITWSDQIHSLPMTRGTGLDLPPKEQFAIIHHHYETVSQYLERLNRYTDVQVEELLHSHAKFSWPDLLIKPADEFLTQYFARQGFTQGVPGLALALLQSFSALVLYLKLWQHSGFPDSPIKLENVKGVVTSKRREAQWWYFQTRIDSSPQVLKPYWKLVRRLSDPVKKSK